MIKRRVLTGGRGARYSCAVVSAERKPWPRRLASLLGPRRFAANVLVDLLIWSAAMALASFLRYEFNFKSVYWADLAKILPIVAVVHLVLGTREGLYVGRWSFGSFEEVAALARCVMITGLFVTLIDWPARWVPISAPAIATSIAMVAMGGVRYAWRLSLERKRRPDANEASRMVVFGAGEGSSQVITGMLRNPQSRFLPVAIIDDDERKQHLRIRGVPVRGRREDLRRVAEEYAADVMLIAIPSADAAARRASWPTWPGSRPGSQVRVLPSRRRAARRPSRRRATSATLTEADLLGRHEIDTDIDADRRLPHRQAGAGDRSRRLDRVGAVPPDPPLRPGRADHARPRRVGAARRPALDRGPGPARLPRPHRWPTSATASVCARCSPSTGPRWSSTPPPSSTCPCSSCHPDEGVKTNVLGHAERPRAAERRTASSGSSTSRPTRRPTPSSVLGYTKRIAERLTAAAAEVGRGHVPQCPVRQRARQPRVGAHHLPGADRRRRWPGHRHRSRRHRGTS